MQSSFGPCWSFIGAVEAGYSDDRFDPGCWASGHKGSGRLLGKSHGIEAAALVDWAGQAKASMLTAGDMKNLSLRAAAAIFAARCWNALRCQDLPAGVDVMVADMGFGTSPVESAIVLQMCVGVDPDGYIGPETIAAAALRNSESLVAVLGVAQDERYRDAENFLDHGPMWLARLTGRAALARRLMFGASSAVQHALPGWRPVPRPRFRAPVNPRNGEYL